MSRIDFDPGTEVRIVSLARGPAEHIAVVLYRMPDLCRECGLPSYRCRTELGLECNLCAGLIDRLVK